MTRDEAIANLKKAKCVPYKKETLAMTIAAFERKRGEWKEATESIGWEEVSCAECSVCGETFVLGDYTMDDIKLGFNYCPNCGAKMDERREDNEKWR